MLLLYLSVVVSLIGCWFCCLCCYWCLLFVIVVLKCLSVCCSVLIAVLPCCSVFGDAYCCVAEPFCVLKMRVSKETRYKDYRELQLFTSWVWKQRGGATNLPQGCRKAAARSPQGQIDRVGGCPRCCASRDDASTRGCKTCTLDHACCPTTAVL